MTAAAEALVGRPLREAERVIDIPRLNRVMNDAKDDLEQAIRDEMLTAVRQWRRRRFYFRPRLHVTPAIRRAVAELHAFGREEAKRELARLGLRLHAAPDPNPHADDPLEEILRVIEAGLQGIAVRIQSEFVEADLTDMSIAAIARALLRIPGGRDIASRVVSSALYSGMGQTFEEADAEGLVGGWEITAVMDAATCGPCDEHDGQTFDTWAQIQALLPNGGPAVYCRGKGRCRCRAVPVA